MGAALQIQAKMPRVGRSWSGAWRVGGTPPTCAATPAPSVASTTASKYCRRLAAVTGVCRTQTQRGVGVGVQEWGSGHGGGTAGALSAHNGQPRAVLGAAHPASNLPTLIHTDSASLLANLPPQRPVRSHLCPGRVQRVAREAGQLKCEAQVLKRAAVYQQGALAAPSRMRVVSRVQALQRGACIRLPPHGAP